MTVPAVIVLLNAHIDGIPKNVICQGSSKVELVRQGDLIQQNLNLQEQLLQREG